MKIVEMNIPLRTGIQTQGLPDSLGTVLPLLIGVLCVFRLKEWKSWINEPYTEYKYIHFMFKAVFGITLFMDNTSFFQTRVWPLKKQMWNKWQCPINGCKQ